jgi:hypothetical protein
MRAHQIENNVVVNTIEVASLDFLPNLVDGENGGGIGDRYENGQFTTPQPDEAVAAAGVREQRNQKLKDSDWTQVADAPVDQAAWAAYRQALRDITSQAGFPWTIDWPEQP